MPRKYLTLAWDTKIITVIYQLKKIQSYSIVTITGFPLIGKWPYWFYGKYSPQQTRYSGDIDLYFTCSIKD